MNTTQRTDADSEAHACHIRATSHTGPKTHDHCILRSLIGQKARDHPSSLNIKQ